MNEVHRRMLLKLILYLIFGGILELIIIGYHNYYNYKL